MLPHLCGYLLLGNSSIVLGAADDGVHTLGLAVRVLNGDLGLTVRLQPRKQPFFAGYSKSLGEVMGQ